MENSIHKPRTLVSTVRCDARDVASTLLFLDSVGLKVNTVADLFREAINVLSEMAIAKGLTERITSTQEAIDLLTRANIVDPRDNKTVRSAIAKAIAHEMLEAGVGTGPMVDQHVSDYPRQESPVQKEEEELYSEMPADPELRARVERALGQHKTEVAATRSIPPGMMVEEEDDEEREE